MEKVRERERARKPREYSSRTPLNDNLPCCVCAAAGRMSMVARAMATTSKIRLCAVVAILSAATVCVDCACVVLGCVLCQRRAVVCLCIGCDV